VKATVVAACCLALVACSSGGEVAAPTTPAPTTAAVTTVAQTSSTEAPTTSSSVVTTTTTEAPRYVTNKVIVTDHGDGSGTITPEYLAGSHMRDDHANQPGYPLPDGTLFVASNPGFDQTWLLSMNTVDLNVVQPTKGWTFAPVSSDPQWTPDACGGVYHALVGTRYEVLADAAPLVPLHSSAPGWNGSDAPIYHGRITIFDLVKRQFFDILPFPNDHTYFQPVAVNDHTLEVLYAPEPSSNNVYGSVKWTRLIRRRVDLTTFDYVDQEIALPHDVVESVNEAQNGSIDLGWTETAADYRTVRGHLVEAPGGRLSFVVDSTAPTYDNWVVDGVKITVDPTNATNALTKVADGSPITTIHTDPGLLGVYGYRAGLLYLTLPIASAPMAGGVHPVGPAVLNPASGALAPLFDSSSPYAGVFVVGILPR
jgi:hypothetical protein